MGFRVVRKYGYGNKNNCGLSLTEFTERNNLLIMNTFLKKPLEKRGHRFLP